MDDKEKKISEETEKKPLSENISEERVSDMKQELEDYIEEQGIYIRQ